MNEAQKATNSEKSLVTFRLGPQTYALPIEPLVQQAAPYPWVGGRRSLFLGPCSLFPGGRGPSSPHPQAAQRPAIPSSPHGHGSSLE